VNSGASWHQLDHFAASATEIQTQKARDIGRCGALF